MTKIRIKAFANRVEEFLIDPSTYNEKRFDSSLFTVIKTIGTRATLYGDVSRVEKTLHGLCFGGHIELVMILLDHAYKGLTDKTTIYQYSRAIAGAMQSFATPIAVGGSGSFPDPNFLLHGINQTTLNALIKRFENNGRIIHETIALKDKFIEKYGDQVHIEHDLKILVEEGAAEDCFGLCCYITKADELDPHGTDKSYISKVSFFLDRLNKEIYVITIQGQRVYSTDKNRSRNFARLAATMGMDPRAFVLKKVCELGKSEGYETIKVIRPKHHPMFFDKHEGFMARYEPIIKQAEIKEENGCYLQKDL
ncbi:MAG: hypothetical protein OEM02_17270 [Desulfobulbaceae bacterium]|nr:hypothetical protein [Desulfobulbaceae bacterium]